ncbi:response regulator [Nocardia brasiliensis]|uniref:Response regulator n=1 Tax=Nocardia brasiliensis TaxID=37326 RepID=A0A6G9XQV4_NOCBR|nr:response regulator transcription factor [Nocardia brasiliensis]QIS03286.1 response regulator [Nocardia brasiliensis]
MIRVALVEDQTTLRGAIRTLLELEPDLTVVADLGSGAGVPEIFDETRPDVVLLDIEMGEESGLALAEKLAERPDPPLLMILTTFERPGYVRRALEAGVRAYLTKNTPVGDIAQAIREVVAGRMLIEDQQLRAAMSVGQNPLTERERDVLVAARSHDTVAEIAAHLHLSVSTVSNYITAAISKTGSRNRIEAIRFAEDNGWL